MEWYNILSIIVGALGGTAGFVGLYKAKSEKTTIDVGNMQTMLDEAHKMYDEMREEKDSVIKEFSDYKKQTMQYIAEFKERFTKVEKRLDKTEDEVFELRSAIYQAYRCGFPATPNECPVLKEYERKQCNDCSIKQDKE